MRPAALLLAALLGGCAWLTASRPGYDSRIMLEPRQRMDFGLVSGRNRVGQHVDEYRCPDEHVMICTSYAVVMECECWRK